MNLSAVYYHSVSSDRWPHSPAFDAVTGGELQAHAQELAAHWAVLSTEELIGHFRDRRPLPRKAVHVSFDDGFRDNLVAAEIFAHHGLPWTVFVVADGVLDGFVPWYVRLGHAIRGAHGRHQWRGEAYDLNTVSGSLALKGAIKQQVLSVPVSEHLEVLDEALLAAALDPEPPASPFLRRSELRELADAGVEVGNHSASHCNLVRCQDDELRHEVHGSRVRLEEALDRPVRSFAYPDGRWDGKVLAEVARCHDLGMATWTSNRPRHPHRVRRFPAPTSVEGLRQVLQPGYALRHRGTRLQRTAKRTARQLSRLVRGRRTPAG